MKSTQYIPVLLTDTFDHWGGFLTFTVTDSTFRFAVVFVLNVMLQSKLRNFIAKTVLNQTLPDGVFPDSIW